MAGRKNRVSRREFLQRGTLAAVSAGIVFPLRAAEKPDPKNILNYNSDMHYRRLGNTDIYLSVISLGGLAISEPVHHYAIDHGVNLVHISKSYKGGQSIRTLSRVMKTRRDKVYLAVKDNFDDIDEILRLMHTDYIDFLMFNRHAKKRVTDPRIFERFEKYHQQGKVRYMGLTTHKHVRDCVAAGIDVGKYTIIMPVLNQPALKEMKNELRLAQQKGVGIMAMKTMKGIRKQDMQIAYLKKVLQNPAVTTVLKGIDSYEYFDAFLKATQETLSGIEAQSLYRYAQQNRSDNCMMCAACEQVCPRQVEISTILRAKDYYFDQLGDIDEALQTYRAVPSHQSYSDACTSCLRCEQVCPNGINIVERLHAAQRVFSGIVA